MVELAPTTGNTFTAGKPKNDLQGFNVSFNIPTGTSQICTHESYLKLRVKLTLTKRATTALGHRGNYYTEKDQNTIEGRNVCHAKFEMRNGFWYHVVTLLDKTVINKAVCTSPMNAMTFIDRTVVSMSNVSEVNNNIFRICGLH